jgi:hypothetical protein
MIMKGGCFIGDVNKKYILKIRFDIYKIKIDNKIK